MASSSEAELESLGEDVKRVCVAVLARAVQDAQGHTFGVKPPARAREVRAEAYEWLTGPGALAFAQLAGIPVERFKRQRSRLTMPTVLEAA